MALHVGEIEEEIGVVDQTGHVHVTEGLEVHRFFVIILAQMPAVVQHRAAEVGFGVAPLLGMAVVDVVIGDEAVAAVFVDEAHQLAHEDRGDGGIGDALPDVHLDGDRFALDLFGEAASFQKTREFFGKGLAGLVTGIGHGGEKNSGCHGSFPPWFSLSKNG